MADEQVDDEEEFMLPQGITAAMPPCPPLCLRSLMERRKN
jgi:hypothetical protein